MSIEVWATSWTAECTRCSWGMGYSFNSEDDALDAGKEHDASHAPS